MKTECDSIQYRKSAMLRPDFLLKTVEHQLTDYQLDHIDLPSGEIAVNREPSGK